MFSLCKDSCKMNYCQDGLEVFFGWETLEFTPVVSLYGYYEIQSSVVNGRSYFKKASLGMWWDGFSKWYIGYDSMKGQGIGFAYCNEDAFCPNKLTSNVDESKCYLLSTDGYMWAYKDLLISCEYMILALQKS